MIKLALPAGDLRGPLARVLAKCGLRVEGYGEGARTYRMGVDARPEVAARVFREKDIPIQVALGNYDLGVCGLAWVKEMQARFPEQPIVPLLDLGIGQCEVYAAAAEGAFQSVSDLRSLGVVRLASEYPNLAEAFAMAARLPRYRVQAVWGAAEAYPPEDADVVVVAANDEASLRGHGLRPLCGLLDSSAWLVANAGSLSGKDLGAVIGALMGRGAGKPRTPELRLPPPLPASRRPAQGRRPREVVRLGLPDGHQQRHVVEALAAAGLSLDGYDGSRCLRRPVSAIEGLEVKVIRPQDMPQLVATGEMDLAITGRDLLMEHLYRFPSSPVVEVVDLQRAQFNLSAVVSEDVPADNIADALAAWRSAGRQVLRVAAELPAVADHYACSRHFWRYRVIPVAGASEGFVPEDAELLIEGTETGRTLAENRLKAIDLLFRSTTCVVARKDAELEGRRREVFESVVEALRRSAGSAPAGGGSASG